jgi:hypothetical protein
VSTSVVVLRKRLVALERYDLLAAVDRGEISHFAAAEAAGIAKRYGLNGNGSENRAKKRDWALAKIEREAKREPQPAKREPELAHPVTPLVPEIADIIRRLVAAGRADLIIAVAEWRYTPDEAAAIVDQGEPPRTPKAAEIADAEIAERTQRTRPRPAPVEKVNPIKPEPEPKKEEPPRYDVRCLIV